MSVPVLNPHPNLHAPLVQALSQQLTTPRPLNPQVLQALTNTYTVPEDAAATFFAERFAELEDYEQDILLSPQLTPKLADCLPALAVLGDAQLEPTHVEALIVALADAGLAMPLALSPEHTIHLPLVAVLLERFVPRLRLTTPLLPELASVVSTRFMPQHQPLLLALLRDELFTKHPHLADITLQLIQHPQAPLADTAFWEDWVSYLRTYLPADAPALNTSLHHYIESCKQDKARAVEHAFADDHLKVEHMHSEANLDKAEHTRHRYDEMIRFAERVLALVA
jgi:hypothetical protein